MYLALISNWLSIPVKLTSNKYTNHIYDKYVANTANDEDNAEHDGNKELGDDVDVLLLFLCQSAVGENVWCFW